MKEWDKIIRDYEKAKKAKDAAVAKIQDQLKKRVLGIMEDNRKHQIDIHGKYISHDGVNSYCQVGINKKGKGIMAVIMHTYSHTITFEAFDFDFDANKVYQIDLACIEYRGLGCEYKHAYSHFMNLIAEGTEKLQPDADMRFGDAETISSSHHITRCFDNDTYKMLPPYYREWYKRTHIDKSKDMVAKRNPGDPRTP